MNELDHLVPIIEAHANELKKPGVISIRPGYRMVDQWPTKEPAIVVITSAGADTTSFPAEIDGTKVDGH